MPDLARVSTELARLSDEAGMHCMEGHAAASRSNLAACQWSLQRASALVEEATTLLEGHYAEPSSRSFWERVRHLLTGVQ